MLLHQRVSISLSETPYLSRLPNLSLTVKVINWISTRAISSLMEREKLAGFNPGKIGVLMSEISQLLA